MRAVVQRVSSAAVEIDGEVVAEIGPGLAVLVAVGKDDSGEGVAAFAEKIAALRVFPDDEGRFDRSVRDIGGSVLVVSNFTLYGDCRRGRRPSFTEAAAPADAEGIYDRFVTALRATGLPVAAGVFRAMMTVRIANDGPVTLILDQPA
jgi:D-tyrosyl-tRNA(Tyr) deacylase